MKIKVLSDSTCDLSQELIEKYNIGIVPLYVTAGDKSYLDGVEIQPEQLYKLVTEEGLTASTAAVNIQTYLDVFSSYLKEYDAIVHFTISSSMSSCYQNACIAAEELGNIYVIDSENLSTGIGHLVINAAEMAAEGMEPAAIKAELDERKKKLDVSFVVDTLDFLRRGGRCSAVEAFGANLLKLHPCIQVRGGAMGVGKKFRGSMDKCYAEYIRTALSEPDTIDTRRIFITDSGISEETRQSLHELVASILPFEEILHTQAGCTVSGHCGPGTMGVLFYRK